MLSDLEIRRLLFFGDKHSQFCKCGEWFWFWFWFLEVATDAPELIKEDFFSFPNNGFVLLATLQPPTETLIRN